VRRRATTWSGSARRCTSRTPVRSSAPDTEFSLTGFIEDAEGWTGIRWRVQMSTPPAAAPAETCPWCLALAYRSPASAPTPSPSTRSSTACESTSPGTRACARRPVTSSRRSVTPSAGAGLCATSHRSPDLRRSAGSVARAVDHVSPMNSSKSHPVTLPAGQLMTALPNGGNEGAASRHNFIENGAGAR